MADKEISCLKKTLKKDINSVECFLMLADMGEAVGATNSPEQSTEVRETIISSLGDLKQSITSTVERILAEIDSAISKMS